LLCVDWCGVKILDNPHALLSAKEALLDENIDHTKFEPVSQDEDKCVMIRSLRKVYETTAEDRVAVKCLNMDIYEGQCTVLLGHNGAGKG
jgi:ATP-binding cassette, subfamily A (ABC1), member 3